MATKKLETDLSELGVAPSPQPDASADRSQSPNAINERFDALFGKKEGERIRLATRHSFLSAVDGLRPFEPRRK